MGALQQQVSGQGKSQVIPSCSMLASQILAEADQIAPRKTTALLPLTAWERAA